MKKYLMAFLSLLFWQGSVAGSYPAQEYPVPLCSPQWFALVYYGKMTNDNLGKVLIFDYTLSRDTLYSLEIGKELSPGNPIKVFFAPLINSIEARANITALDDNYGVIYELNPYMAFNWHHFPWCHKLKTVFTFGEGISYVTKVPFTEEQHSDQPKKLLNFLLFEVGFALPCYPQYEIVVRAHHRSGAFGLYHANNTGSTAIGLAMRYRF